MPVPSNIDMPLHTTHDDAFRFLVDASMYLSSNAPGTMNIRPQVDQMMRTNQMELLWPRGVVMSGDVVSDMAGELLNPATALSRYKRAGMMLQKFQPVFLRHIRAKWNTSPGSIMNSFGKVPIFQRLVTS
jgi:hypothetical protein